MNNIFEELTKTIKERKSSALEGSYTKYLFDQGTDKILKKCIEECGEVLIAAKNAEKNATVSEICDLFYHIFVLMNNEGIALEDIETELYRRSGVVSNKKPTHQVDKET